MSIQAVAWALKQETGSPTLKLVLIAIANYADEKGRCWPSQERLARDTEVTDRSIRDALKKLEALGYLTRTHRQVNGNKRQTDIIQLVYRRANPDQKPAEDISGGEMEDFSGGPAEDGDKATGSSRQKPPEPASGKPSVEPSDREPSDVTRAKRASHTDFPKNAFEVWFEGYPHRVGRTAAEKAFEKIRKGGQVAFATLIAGRDRYIATKPHHVEWCNPATWLNQGRWDDAPAITAAGAIHGQPANRNYRTDPAARQSGTAARVAAIMGYGPEPEVHGPSEERRLPDRPAWQEGGDTSRIIDAQPLRAGLYRA